MAMGFGGTVLWDCACRVGVVLVVQFVFELRILVHLSIRLILIREQV